ncbi:MAG: tRNA (adenosine(37)-N6)-threonylcarbamoyltransferase complex ATPase subunit type 1 TsaE [Hyphomonadaceae bacterium]|nr:tRNA (adenosine(37)-N6)-threonylcarbamoyltransferase complex ATPase subunit type 1 TsaE [Hyphomonadaceae bacterium]
MSLMPFPSQHVTRSAGETVALGRALARALRDGDVVLLCGPMGAGKTYFAKGVVAELSGAEEDEVASPAYDIVHQFSGRETVFHYDLFRLQALSDDDVAWLMESLSEAGVHVLEWGERIEGAMRRPHYKITIAASASENERVVAFEVVP